MIVRSSDLIKLQKICEAYFLQLCYVNSLRTLLTLNDVILYSSAFFKRFESFHVQSGVMYEYIMTSFIRNESIALLVVKPFNCTFVHVDTSKKNKLYLLHDESISHSEKKVKLKLVFRNLFSNM